MLLSTVGHLRHRDVIGLNHNDEFIAGEVVKIARDTNGIWIVNVLQADGTDTGVYLRSDEEFLLIHMDDKDNPAVTRNDQKNWPSCGIRETSLEEFKSLRRQSRS